jgi:hypothetical protein
MPTVTLTHCVPVTIYQSEADASVTLTVSVGGDATDGAVSVATTPFHPTVPVLCGTAPPPVTFDPCKCITLHYVKTPLGPDTVDVDYELVVR